jgi:acetyltransferase-like isoleucine patch superfamily enzyme
MANVGEGSLVAAGAIVTHDTDLNVVVAGNPAKLVRNMQN